MQAQTLQGLFITGTDTGVGKTFVAAAIVKTLKCRKTRVGALKPVATGATREGPSWRAEDAESLIAALGCGVETRRVTPLVYEEPLAPCVAAQRAGTPLFHADLLAAVTEALTWWSDRANLMIVEGVGGLLCPLAADSTVADLAIALDYPLIIVAHRGLGTLNHTLLTVEAATRRGLRLAGVVLNGAKPTVDPIAEETNPGELVRHLQNVPLLAELPHGLTVDDLNRRLDIVDWQGLAKGPRRIGTT